MTNPTWLPRKVSAARAARFTTWAAAGLFICALAAVGAPAVPAQSFDIVAEHNRRAVALVERGEHEDAVTEWREALRTAPENVPIHLNLGIVLMKIGRLEEAEEVLLDAVRLDPRRPKAHLLLGRAYLRQGKTRMAETELTTAQRLDPTDPAIDIALAVLATRRGQWQAAEAHLKRALTFKYNDPTTHAALGDVYQAMGDLSQAEKAYRKALSLDASHQGGKRGLRKLEMERRRSQGSTTGILQVEDPVTRIERGRYVVEGQVVNISERATAKYVTVVCRFLDRAQRTVSEVEAHTEPESLGPGQRGTWRLSVANTPKLSGQFDIGVKAIIEDPEADQALREAAESEAGAPRKRRPKFFGGDEVEPGDALKVSIPRPATQEGEPVLRGFVVNVGDHPVASIDIIIRLFDRMSGNLHTQRFARLDHQFLRPGERADYSLEWEEGLDFDRFRPTMAVSWADLPKSEDSPSAASSEQPEATTPAPTAPGRLPTHVPEPLPTRPRR